jgi:Mrp family chromosome partitioning ATPase
VAHDRAQAIADAYVAYWIQQQPPLQQQGSGRAPDILASSVLSDATLPTAPSSPNHEVDLVIALVIGLALGVGTAYLRDRMDDRLRDARDFERHGGPILTTVPRTRRRPWQAPAIVSAPTSSQASAYADLVVHLLRVTERRLVHLVLVTTPSGAAHGAVSANLAVGLAEAGRSVLLVHADLRRQPKRPPEPDDAAAGFAAVIRGGTELADVLEPTGIPRLHEVSSGVVQGNVAVALHSQELRATLRRLPDFADIAVVEGPPVLAGPDVSTIAEMADAVVLVGDSRHTTRREVDAAVARLGTIGAKFIGSVLVTGSPTPDGPTVLALPRSPSKRPEPGPGLARVTPASELDEDDDIPMDELQANGWPDAVPTGKR